jgi:hypothetical protein
MNIEISLKIVALVQLGISVLNLFLIRMMRWKDDMDQMPLLIREVFKVHSWFISLTVLIFSVMTWKFASEMVQGTNLACTWLACLIGAFWLFRTFLQIAYYSSSHWRDRLGRTLIHISCLIVYGGMAAVYLFTAFQAWRPR